MSHFETDIALFVTELACTNRGSLKSNVMQNQLAITQRKNGGSLLTTFVKATFLQRTFSKRGIRYCYDVIKECKTESSDRDKRSCEESPTGLAAGYRSYKNYKTTKTSIAFYATLRTDLFQSCGPRFLSI